MCILVLESTLVCTVCMHGFSGHIHLHDAYIYAYTEAQNKNRSFTTDTPTNQYVHIYAQKLVSICKYFCGAARALLNKSIRAYCDLQNHWDMRDSFQQFPGSKLVLKTVEKRSACLSYFASRSIYAQNQVSVCKYFCRAARALLTWFASASLYSDFSVLPAMSLALGVSPGYVCMHVCVYMCACVCVCVCVSVLSDKYC